LRAFLPASQVELRPVQDFNKYVGQTLDMKVVKISRRRYNIVLSRRILLEEEAAARKADLLSTLEVDQTRTGFVKNITSFGAFVDLGGIDGLLHKTDMSWGKINHPSEIVSIGDKVEVKVIGIDHEYEKVSLVLKQKTEDPWLDIEEKYPVDSTVHGKIVNIVNYGAFLELEEGVEGLIHVSEMSWTRRNVAPSKIVNKGEEIDAVVLEINKENKRISLGLKQLQENPWELLEQKYPIGTRITGHVRNLTDFGSFVEIEDGIDGLIHTSDLSWVKRDAHPRDFLKEGDEVEVMVLQIDSAERKVSLGLKQIEPDPWLQVPEKYKIGSVVRGEIVNLTNFGAFAKLEDGIEGLIHISELSERRIEKPEDIISIGDQLDLKVIHLDPNERRIGLSLKAAQAEQERAVVSQYQQRQRQPQPQKPREEPTTALGALLKEELEKSEER
jgi:small subunit ribosomal protein S1